MTGATAIGCSQGDRSDHHVAADRTFSQAELDAHRDWQRQRTEKLLARDGWLNLVGLLWLEEGDNTLGADPRVDLVLPDSASLAELPAVLGTLTLETTEPKGDIHGSEAKVRDRHATVTLSLRPEVVIEQPRPFPRDGELVVFETGQPAQPFRLTEAVEATIIERGGFFGLRLRDLSISAEELFSGIEVFPPAAEWIVEATFEPYREPREIPFPNQTRLEYPQTSSGELVFELAGKSHRVSVLGSDVTAPLFLVLGDATNGSETYSGGRFVYSDPPRVDGSVRVDFNRLYNPPCVFTSWATCPLPPPQNRLPVRIEAGEKLYTEEIH